MGKPFSLVVVDSRIPQLIAKAPHMAKAMIKRLTFQCEREAKYGCPVDTGYLKSTIQSRFENKGFVGIIDVGALYGIYVNFGTWCRGPNPFMSNAVASVQAVLQQVLNENFDRLVRDAGCGHS
ncbi:MAG: hypothetical protein KAY24_00110 [Candidatus Eisenbacteria sp.]|nr:hypothetical protein [Candidatus Eisenbacteria bacterium]